MADYQMDSMFGKIALILLLIGGFNWGLIGLGEFIGQNLNLVNMFLGGIPNLEASIYLLVGISAGIVTADAMEE